MSALRAFEAAARHRSFKRAAGELGVTPTAISHQVRLLEEHVATPLFERRARRVELTAAARALYPVLRDGFDAFAAAVERLSGSPRPPAVRLTATTAFIARWLLPRVRRFQAAHPHVELQLHASDAVVDIAAAGVDLAVRYGRGPYPGLRAEAMIADRFAPLVNPALAVRTPDDLRRVALIHFDWQAADPANPTWDAWFRTAGLRTAEPASHLRFSDESHAIQAAVAGQGVAMLSLVLARDEIEAGRLVQPFGPVIDGFTYHLVESSDRPRSAPAELARSWMMAELRPAT